VIYPLTAFRAAARAAEVTLRELRDTGSQRNSLPSMQTRAELYDLIGYAQWEERDRAYFSGDPPRDSASTPDTRGKPSSPLPAGN
jgi:methylisocitrate lyase